MDFIANPGGGPGLEDTVVCQGVVLVAQVPNEYRTERRIENAGCALGRLQ